MKIENLDKAIKLQKGLEETEEAISSLREEKAECYIVIVVNGAWMLRTSTSFDKKEATITLNKKLKKIKDEIEEL